MVARAKVSLHKAALLSADDRFEFNTNHGRGLARQIQTIRERLHLRLVSGQGTITLDQVSVAVLSKALENIASLRAQNGGTMSRLTFSDGQRDPQIAPT